MLHIKRKENRRFIMNSTLVDECVRMDGITMHQSGAMIWHSKQNYNIEINEMTLNRFMSISKL